LAGARVNQATGHQLAVTDVDENVIIFGTVSFNVLPAMVVTGICCRLCRTAVVLGSAFSVVVLDSKI
jgi:hypothetical protein